MIHVYRIFDFLLRLLIYYAYYKAKQAFLSFLPAFKLLPLFSLYLSEFSLILPPFRLFMRFCSIFLYLSDISLIRHLYCRRVRLLFFLLNYARIYSVIVLFRPFLPCFYESARFYGFSACFPLFVGISRIFSAFPLIFEFFFSVAHIKVFYENLRLYRLS